MKTRFRILCAILAWTVIFGQYFVLIAERTYGGLAATTLAYFGFFTVTTNILVALAFSVPLLKPDNSVRRFFERQSVRAAIALYILVVAVIYYGVLAASHNPEGISALFNIGLHFLLPVLYILDWLIFSPKGSMSFRHVPYWSAYPIAYGLFNLIRGQITGFYPYPFLDVPTLGLNAVSLNMLGFTLFYTIGGVIFICLGRILSRNRIESETARR